MNEKLSSAFENLKEMAENSHLGEKLKDAAEAAVKAAKESLRNNPGAAIDKADDNKVTPSLVDEQTRAENNNPRNSDM